MKTKHNLIENIKEAFVKLADCKLTLKEKKVLYLLSNKSSTVRPSKLANEIKLQLNCSESTAWNIIKSLRSLGLIKNDSLEISIEGKLIARSKDD